MDMSTIPEDAIRTITVKNYNFEDRDLPDNIEVTIHFNEDHPLSDLIDCGCLSLKALMFTAVELERLREATEDES